MKLLSGPVSFAYRRLRSALVTLLYIHFFISVCLLSHPDEYKSKVVCEEERMRLSCKQGMQIAVYSAMFGRTQQGTLECPLHHRRAPSVGEAPTIKMGKKFIAGCCATTFKLL